MKYPGAKVNAENEERRWTHMKKKTRMILTLLLVAVFIVSTGALLRQFRDNAGGEDAYADALAIASGDGAQKETEAAAEETIVPTQPQTAWVPAPVEDGDPVLEEMMEIDLTALREVNADVVGWIRIPETKIDYPLMQGQDNEYYLNRTWQGNRNSVGSIFLESRNQSDMMDYNTIVYGHNMADGSMFAALRKYNQAYWEKHPYVYILTDAAVYRYEIFAAYKAQLDAPTYGLSFYQSSTRANFINYALENSAIDTQIIPEERDRILTLSTCSGAGYTNRWVVQARLKMVETEIG